MNIAKSASRKVDDAAAAQPVEAKPAAATAVVQTHGVPAVAVSQLPVPAEVPAKPPSRETPGAQPLRFPPARPPKSGQAAGGSARKVAKPAGLRPRHRRLMWSFIALVIAPIALAAGYLTAFATPQYASYMAFTVRSEGKLSAASELMGGFGALLGGSASSDTDILQNFVLSQEMVSRVSQRIDLSSVYSGHRESDPVFSYHPEGGTIESLTRYWKRMVRTHLQIKSGILEFEILAFTPGDAQRIATIVHEESTAMINNLSAIAREDALRYAGEDLARALEQVVAAREAITGFRVEHQIVDVEADVQGQYGVLNTLQQQLATALVEYDLLRGSTTATDPRLPQVELRITAIRDRIAEERQKVGYSDGEASYATIAGEYERLTVEREFAEALYVSAMRQHELALAEANRQTRYLATHIQPTRAEAAEFPRNGFILATVALFAFLSWAVMSLVYYALRDRN